MVDDIFDAINFEELVVQSKAYSYGDLLAQFRRNRKMKIDVLCGLAVITPTQYHKYRNNEDVPKRDTLKRIILALRLSVSEAQQLWACSGYYASTLEDLVFFKCIELGEYDIDSINNYLFARSLNEIEIPED